MPWIFFEGFLLQNHPPCVFPIDGKRFYHISIPIREAQTDVAKCGRR